MNFRFLSPIKGFISATSFLVAFALLSFSSLNAQPDGAEIFSSYCSSCHKVDGKSTGPWIKDARSRWEANSSTENLYKWVKNSAEVIKSCLLYTSDAADD